LSILFFIYPLTGNRNRYIIKLEQTTEQKCNKGTLQLKTFMIKTIIIILFLAFCFANSQPQVLNNCLSDTFGYYYLDSDTTAPGAPVFNWASIYNRGTRISGLADDNVKGPTPLGFNFKYYWGMKNSLYIGSNGYVSFDDDFLSALPFQSLPSCQRPNNIIAPLMTDLDFTVGTPSCWYWTNASDTFIAEFDSVQFWSTGGLATFQIILCRSDSSITFQYLTMQGNPSGGWLSVNSNTVGIENSLGNVGVQYLKDGIPAGNVLHGNLAIKFFKALVTQPAMHDARVVNAMNKQSGAIFLHPGSSFNVWTRVENSGNDYEDYYPVYAKITNEQASLVYADSEDLTCRIPGMIDSLMFLNTWLPANTGRYRLNVQTALTGDICPENDMMQVEVNVIDSFSWNYLAYDSEPSILLDWNRPAGFANQFVPPHYPWYIGGARIYASAPSPTNVMVKVFDDNGSGNSPGDVLAQADMTVSNPNWYGVQFPDPIVTIYDGAFFIGATSSVANLSFGMDTIPPFSHRLWEYTGTWSPSRFSLNRDVCIRSLDYAGTEELPKNNVSMTHVSILPNPIRNFATIRFTNPTRDNKSVRIYNSSGALVRILVTKDEMVMWDGKNSAGIELANGCYFVHLDDRSVAGNRDATLRVNTLRKVIIAR